MWMIGNHVEIGIFPFLVKGILNNCNGLWSYKNIKYDLPLSRRDWFNNSSVTNFVVPDKAMQFKSQPIFGVLDGFFIGEEVKVDDPAVSFEKGYGSFDVIQRRTWEVHYHPVCNCPKLRGKVAYIATDRCDLAPQTVEFDVLLKQSEGLCRWSKPWQ